MENKTEYTLQDAKDELSRNSGTTYREFYLVASFPQIIEVNDRAAELYKSKATEELRKENAELKYWQEEKDKEADSNRVSVAVAEIESDLAEKVKEGVEAIWERDFFKNEVRKLNEEIEHLTQSNKELQETVTGRLKNLIDFSEKDRKEWIKQCKSAGPDCGCGKICCFYPKY